MLCDDQSLDADFLEKYMTLSKAGFFFLIPESNLGGTSTTVKFLFVFILYLLFHYPHIYLKALR